MGDLFMWIGMIFLFFGLPASIVLTIIAFVKKWKLIFKLSVPIVINLIVIFFFIGAMLLPDTEVTNQESVKTEKQETESIENNEKLKEELKVEKEEVEDNVKTKEKDKKKEKAEKPKEEKKETPKKEETPKELTESEYKNACKEYKYKDVLRNPENYIGQKIVITVQISTVMSKSWLNPTIYYFAYSEYKPGTDIYMGDLYAIFDKRKNQDELKLLEDDVIRVWGEIIQPEETTSLIVNPEEVFCIDMKYVELISE